MRASGGDDIERQRVCAHRLMEYVVEYVMERVAHRAMDLLRARGKRGALRRLCNIVECAKHGDRTRASCKHARTHPTALG